MEKALNFLHPLGNFEGCSKKSSGYLQKREETLGTSPLFQHTNSRRVA